MFSYHGIKIKACKGVYEPAEDSFLLAETLDAGSGESVLDIGTGTGILGLIAARNGGKVLAVDISDAALKCARENARLNGLINFLTRKSDLFSNVAERFDLIILNPPYLPTEKEEPKDGGSLAWDGGPDGRVVIDRFLAGAKRHLNRGGRILMVGSSLSDHQKTMGILKGQSFDVSVLTSKKLGFEKLVVIRAVYDF